MYSHHPREYPMFSYIACSLDNVGRYREKLYVNHFWSYSKPYYKHFYLHFCAQDIPRIRKKPPSSMTVKEGSNVSLPCYSKGFPNPEVTWYKNGQKLNSGKYNRDTGMLTFPSIQFSDRGLYRCEARNFIGVESATVKIVVEGTGNLICNVIVV